MSGPEPSGRASDGPRPNGPGLFDLDGRLAVVTGADRGIGRAMAVALAEAGADVIGVSRSVESDGGEVGSIVRAAGRRFTGERCDLSDRQQVDELVERLSAGRPVDVLVNNAGIVRRSSALDHTDADWDDVLEVDLGAPFRLARGLGRRMVERGSGRVIFTASLMSFQSGAGAIGYAAAKAGVLGLVRTLADEWAPYGVTVNAIAPGYITTELTGPTHDDPSGRERIRARIPMGRWGRPSDLAGATVFLASDASTYVTGVTLPVDGGWLAR